MPLGVKPVCSKCKTTTSTMWRKGPVGEVLCNSCGLKAVNGNGKESGSDEVMMIGIKPARIDGRQGSATGSHYVGALRKSARLKPSRHKPQTAPKALATKGKSRRVIFKKNPIKAPASVATVVTSECIFYEGIYYQVGDIVSVMDHDGGIYYAQIRGFMQDQYCNKSAVITWLLPTTSSAREKFEPSTYILGPEEDLPRKMECFEFVCHAPSGYFKSRDSPYPTISTKPELGFIWTNIGPEIKPIPTTDEIFGSREIKCEHTKSKDKEKDKKESKEKEKIEPKIKKEIVIDS